MNAQKENDKRPIGLDEAGEILPWYLIGRTSRAETEEIESLLKESADLRTQLDAVRLQRQAIRDNAEEMGGPSAASLTRLLQQIDGTKQRRLMAEEEPGFFARLFGLRSRPVLQFSLAAACVAIIAQGTFLTRSDMVPATSPSQNAPAFSTASVASAPIAETLGPILLVSFRPEVTTAQFSQILTELQAVVIGGPKPGLTFVLQLPTGESADAAIARLQSRPDLVATAQRR